MQSIWPYLVASIIAAIILTLAVIGGYEVFRNTKYWARERRIKRYNTKCASYWPPTASEKTRHDPQTRHTPPAP